MDKRQELFTSEEYGYWLNKFPVIVSHWENDIRNLKRKYLYTSRTGDAYIFDVEVYSSKKKVIDIKYVEILRSLIYGEIEQESKSVN